MNRILKFVLLTNILVGLPAYSQESPVICSSLDECRKMDALIHAEIIKLEKNLPSRFAKGQNEKKTEFVRDTSNPALGEAWRDPKGMIWGDIVRDEDGSVRHMDHFQASTYCESIGAQLPSKYDFQRLRAYMGGTFGFHTGYKPQVLPNLFGTEEKRTLLYYFWSSQKHPADESEAFYFDGHYGLVAEAFRNVATFYSVRCVNVSE